MATSPLRKWMRKEEVYDKDFETLLDEAGIKNPPGDLKNLSQNDWDEIVRKGKVLRFKELKDQASRSRLEKKIKKMEKIWRAQSGIVATSIKKGKKKDSNKKKQAGTAADKKKKEALASNQKLKKFMQKNEIWEQELFLILTDLGCESGNDFKDKITSNDEFDEVYRKVRVARTKDLKSNDAKLRMEKLMTKFEKIWRKQSGIKKTAQTKKTKKGGAKKNPKDAKAEELSGAGAKLKKWLQKNQIWEKQLYEELVRQNVEDKDALSNLSEEKFDEIIRSVRVEKFKELKDQASRNRLDKLLVKFEKIWRKESGIVKTSIKPKGGSDKAKDDDSKDPPKEDNNDNNEDDKPDDDDNVAQDDANDNDNADDADNNNNEDDAGGDDDAGDNEDAGDDDDAGDKDKDDKE